MRLVAAHYLGGKPRPQRGEAGCNRRPPRAPLPPRFPPASDPCAACRALEVGEAEGILRSGAFGTHVPRLPPLVFLPDREPSSQNRRANCVPHGAKASGVLNLEPIRLGPFCYFSFCIQDRQPVRCSSCEDVGPDALLPRRRPWA